MYSDQVKIGFSQKKLVSHNMMNSGSKSCCERCPHLVSDNTLNMITSERYLWETKRGHEAYPYDHTLLQVIQSLASSYELQKKNPKRINIGFLVHYAMREILRSKIPATQSGYVYICLYSSELLSELNLIDSIELLFFFCIPKCAFKF